MMHCSKTAAIIVYRNNNDIDVQFGDGTVVTHKHYLRFKCGKIACPNNVTKYTINNRSRLNETKTMKNGFKATIVEYTTYHDITVLFEDGCKVHSCYEYFKKGTITTRTRRLNQTVVQRNGLKATIIAYRKNGDIDIQFEDGTILKRKRYSDFRKGAIVNPNKKER